MHIPPGTFRPLRHMGLAFIQILKFLKAAVPRAIQGLYRLIFRLQAFHQPLLTYRPRRIIKNLIRDHQIIHERPGRLIPKEIPHHPGIPAFCLHGLRTFLGIQPVFLTEHVREIPENILLCPREPGKRSYIRHPRSSQQSLITPVPQSIHPIFSQLPGKHALPLLIPFLSESPVKICLFKRKQRTFPSRLPDRRPLFMKLIHSAIHGILPVRQPVHPFLHAVHTAVTACHHTIRPHAEKSIPQRIHQPPTPIFLTARKKSRSLSQFLLFPSAIFRPVLIRIPHIRLPGLTLKHFLHFSDTM